MLLPEPEISDDVYASLQTDLVQKVNDMISYSDENYASAVQTNEPLNETVTNGE